MKPMATLAASTDVTLRTFGSATVEISSPGCTTVSSWCGRKTSSKIKVWTPQNPFDQIKAPKDTERFDMISQLWARKSALNPSRNGFRRPDIVPMSKGWVHKSSSWQALRYNSFRLIWNPKCYLNWFNINSQCNWTSQAPHHPGHGLSFPARSP